jgi:hypothetical protein
MKIVAKPSSETRARKPWVAPRFQTLEAGAAEAGATPIRPEGTFGSGS